MTTHIAAAALIGLALIGPLTTWTMTTIATLSCAILLPVCAP